MLIKNGTLANSKEEFISDIRIEDGIITEIGTNLEKSHDDEVVIDATDKIVIPGGIDVHTHLDLDVGIATATDDFYTGTVAAAIGGTTTIVDHIGFGEKGCPLTAQIEKYHGLAEGKAVIDYSFHGVFQHLDDNTYNEMKKLRDEGITSFKIYLTYDYKLSDEEVFKILRFSKELGIVIAVHPENDAVINILKHENVENGNLSPVYHAKSRPLEAEAEAISKMILFSKMAGDAPLYIVHLSNGLGLKFLTDAKSRGQKNIFVETCPQYLFLDESLYEREDALKYIMSPPLRSIDNNEKLFDGIINNEIDVIGTDHCPFFYNKEKQRGKDDFSKCPNGAPGIETRIPLMFSKGVMDGKISLSRFVEICSEKPAKIFGLFPKKGILQVGSDADIVIIDKTIKKTITKDILHENTDYTPYENIEVTGYPVLTMSRGKIIAKDGNFVGEKGYGEFIKREVSSLIE